MIYVRTNPEFKKVFMNITWKYILPVHQKVYYLPSKENELKINYQNKVNDSFKVQVNLVLTKTIQETQTKKVFRH